MRSNGLWSVWHTTHPSVASVQRLQGFCLAPLYFVFMHTIHDPPPSMTPLEAGKFGRLVDRWWREGVGPSHCSLLINGVVDTRQLVVSVVLIKR